MFKWNCKKFINPCNIYFRKYQQINFVNPNGNYKATILKIYTPIFPIDFYTNCIPQSLYFNMMFKIKYNNKIIDVPSESLIQISNNNYASLEEIDYNYINNIISQLYDWNNPIAKSVINNLTNAYEINYELHN